uniref:Uncharacterized protein n=1 Tax=Anguilla anguilla TaxID=7936 RepID=A0A0E9RR88_ANGAN
MEGYQPCMVIMSILVVSRMQWETCTFEDKLY